MLGVLDIGLSNIGSLESALKNLNTKFKYCLNPDDFSNITKIILPGVGNFKKCMEKLVSKNLDKAILNFSKNNKSLLGICLGYQILFEGSEEGNESKGLALAQGNFINLNEIEKNLKTPHAGWNECKVLKSNKLFEGINNNSDFYFTHSYVLKNFDKNDVISVTDYTFDFVSSIQKRNIFGVQFHPEKSQANGLKILKNFIDFC